MSFKCIYLFVHLMEYIYLGNCTIMGLRTLSALAETASVDNVNCSVGSCPLARMKRWTPTVITVREFPTVPREQDELICRYPGKIVKFLFFICCF